MSFKFDINTYQTVTDKITIKQGHNQLGKRGGRAPPVKSCAPSKMLFIVIARRSGGAWNFYLGEGGLKTIISITTNNFYLDFYNS